jgi:hypothetical protein
MIQDRKVCGDCKIEKDKSEFPLRKKKNGYVWLRLQCYQCMRVRNKIRYDKNSKVIIERNKLYSQKNKEKVYERQNKWKIENQGHVLLKRKERYKLKGEEIREKRKNYYYNNREKCIESVNNYNKKNIKRVREKQRLNHKKKKQDNIQYRILKLLRGRIFQAVKNKRKRAYRTMELTGCDMSFLISHLENKFTNGMTWDNQGIKGWHIDHIKPCSRFDLTKKEEQKKCFHYSNLQPLWWYDNLIKSDKWEEANLIKTI